MTVLKPALYFTLELARRETNMYFKFLFFLRRSERKFGNRWGVRFDRTPVCGVIRNGTREH